VLASVHLCECNDATGMAFCSQQVLLQNDSVINKPANAWRTGHETGQVIVLMRLGVDRCSMETRSLTDQSMEMTIGS
jgi:hypothetical protein